MGVPEDSDWLAEQFEAQRGRMRGVAYRILGSASEADDAVQEAWLRLSGTDSDAVANLPAWLTTVVARVSLNMLRARATRREVPIEPQERERAISDGAGSGPEQETLLAESVGLALLVVLDTLSPAERLAFVLHDMFDLPFDEIAPIVRRSPAATRQLASRARRRIKGKADTPPADLARQRRVIEAYLAAIRSGDIEALVRLLNTDVELRADAAATPQGTPVELHGAQVVARAALASFDRVRHSSPALVGGAVGIVMAPRGHLFLVLGFTFDGDTITAIDVIADSARLRALDLAVVD